MSRRVGLDASSREVLLDLIYRLSLDDDEGSGKAREREARRERKREKKSRRGDVGDDGGDGDDSDDEARRARARVKEARRAEKERERKEKVLRRALREDRKNPAGEAGTDADVSHPGLAAAPHPAGAELRLSVTSAGGEIKLMSVKRADNLKDFLSAAKAKLKLKKKPLSARMHAPPGPEIADTLRVEPMATVLVSPDPPAAPPSRPKPKPRTSSRGERRPGDEDDDEDDDGDGDGDDDDDDASAASAASDASDDDASVTTRLRDAAAFAARLESSRWRRVVDPATVAAESARLLAASRDPPPAANAARRQRASLPASSARDAIISAVFDSGAAATVITGDTGSGKTTQAPQFVLERAIADGVGAETCIIVAQPRRVAAVSIARRVAEERGERVGDVVGYRVRGESRVSDRTRLVFVTTGVLLRRLAADPELEGVTHVFVDEVHERTADADFLLVLLRRLLRDRAEAADARSDGDQMRVAPSPRVVLMSATTDAARLSAYFDGTGAKHAPPPPRAHPRSRVPRGGTIRRPVRRRRDGAAADRESKRSRKRRRRARDETGGGGVDYAALATVVRRLCEEASAKGDEGDGAVLVFYPARLRSRAPSRNFVRFAARRSFPSTGNSPRRSNSARSRRRLPARVRSCSPRTSRRRR